MDRTFLLIGALSGLIGVAFGAFGAHALKGKLSDADLHVYDIAIRYHFIHAFGILFLAAFLRKLRQPVAVNAYRLFALGVILFCGSLYFLALQKVLFGVELKWVGIITPIGGVSFICGWLLLATKGYRVPHLHRHESAVRDHSHQDDQMIA